MNWIEHEKELHSKYNIPNDRIITAVLGNGTVVTVLNDYGQPSMKSIPPTEHKKVVLLPPD